MAEKIISPGVFTNEKDLSYLPSGIGNIGAAIIGPTLKGPAFIPNIVSSFNEFIALYGGLSTSTYVPYTVKNYLKNAGTVTIIRVMTSEAWTQSNSYAIKLTAMSGSKAGAPVTITNTGSAFYLTGSNGTIYTLTPGTANALVTSTTYTFATGSNNVTASMNLNDLLNAYAAFGVSSSVSQSVIPVLALTASVFGTEGNSIALQTGSAIASRVALTGGTYFTTGNAKVVAYLVPNGTTANNTGSSTLTLLTGSNTNGLILGTDFVISSSIGSASVSLTKSSAKALNKVFGTDPFTTSPNSLANSYYLYRVFADVANASASYSASIENIPLVFNTNKAYNHGKTPYITSQLVSGDTYNLFRAHRRSDGLDSNYDVKVIIEDIRKPGSVAGSDFATFTLTVRTVGGYFTSTDTNDRPDVLETFTNLNLDVNSPNFILRRIGNRYATVDAATGDISYTGEYKNVSKYIYIEDVADFTTIQPTLFPAGFKAVNAVVSSSLLPVIPYVTDQGNSISYNKRIPFGFNFFADDANQYLYSIPDAGETIAVGSNFNLDNMFAHASSSAVGNDNVAFAAGTSLSASNAPVEMLKFAVPLQYGHTGMAYNRKKYVDVNISATNVFGLDCSTSTKAGAAAYITALNTISNQDEFDVNMIVTPGIISSLHSAVTDKAIEVCSDRGDAFYIMDTVALTDNVAAAINNVSNFDTNYASTWYPWIKLRDTDLNKDVWCPPSVVMPGVMANNDKVAYEWYAPAGLNRGGLPDVIEAYKRLKQSDRDELYLNRINPIATFPGQGVVVWGQKTLQSKPSALDRINVRRLLITLKKYIASASRYLVFENNTTSTRNRFLNIVNPYLETVKQRQGLYAFKVVMDETNNTPDVIDRNIMYGQIFLQPSKTAEFIVLDFNLLPTGAQFSNA